MMLSMYNAGLEENNNVRRAKKEKAPGSVCAITKPSSPTRKPTSARVVAIGSGDDRMSAAESEIDLHEMMYEDLMSPDDDEPVNSSLQAAAQMAHISVDDSSDSAEKTSDKKISKETSKKSSKKSTKTSKKKSQSNNQSDSESSTAEGKMFDSPVGSPKKASEPRKKISKRLSVAKRDVQLNDDDLTDEVQDLVDRFGKKHKYSVADILLISKSKNLRIARLKQQQKDIAPLIDQLQLTMMKSTMSFKNFPLFENVELRDSDKESRKIIESINNIITPNADKIRIRIAELTAEIKKFMENVRQTYTDYIALYKLFNHIYKHLSDKDKPVADQMLKRDTGAYHDIPCDPSKPVDWDQFNQDFMNAAVHNFETTY